MTPEPGTGEPQRRPLSLRARLVWLAGLSIAVIGFSTSYFRNQIIENAVESESADAAGATALGVAADLTDRDTLPTPTELEDLRVEFMKAVPALRALTVTQLKGDTMVLAASTEDRPVQAILELARQATSRRELVSALEANGKRRLVAAALERDRRPYGAVVVSLARDSVERVHRQTRGTSLIFAPLSILLLTGLIDFLTRRLVFRPLAAIRETMSRASAGDLQARVTVNRADEIGALATGLNAMLDRLADFNAALRHEVRRATEELRDRNRQLWESAQRLFAARRELAKSEKLAVTGQMAASVAHQIGTPLNVISGYVQMIQEELPPDSPPAVRLRTVQEQIGKVTAIVQGLLDQARRPALVLKPISPVTLISGICELVRPTLESARIELRTVVDPHLPLVDVDAGQVEQVFLSLITNSIDAMPEGGSLTISVHAHDEHVDFAVADSGTGISPQDLDQIFDPLFTTKRPGKGTGLGLTIVREVLSAHGGSVHVSSEPQRGTVVTVRLPRARVAEGARA